MLFPGMERVSGIRKFGEAELEALRMIDCLKKSGLEIKDGNEDRLKAIIPDNLPGEIRALYENAHSE